MGHASGLRPERAPPLPCHPSPRPHGRGLFDSGPKPCCFTSPECLQPKNRADACGDGLEEDLPHELPLAGQRLLCRGWPDRHPVEGSHQRQQGDQLCRLVPEIRRLPRGQIWRYGQAGDLPGEGDEIDGEQLGELAAANARRPAIVFTHKPPTAANLKHLRAAADKGLHINLSADSLAEADELASTGLSVVTILSSEYGRNHGETLSAYRTRRRGLPNHTPGGLRIAICPATYLDVTCVECQVCSRPGRMARSWGFRLMQAGPVVWMPCSMTLAITTHSRASVFRPELSCPEGLTGQRRDLRLFGILIDGPFRRTYYLVYQG
jgi:hypothetical protein